MGEFDWIPLFSKVEGNRLINPENHPKMSGDYICTCIYPLANGKFKRFLKIKHYCLETDRWHDVGNPSGLSHIILAYIDRIDVCDVDFEYEVGGVVLKKTK